MIHKHNFIIAIFLIIIFVIPLMDNVGKILFTDDDFAFRAWEVMYDRSTPGPFKPNAHFEKEIFGDLANMLKVRTFFNYRFQKFTTDKFGFRNPDYQDDTYFPIVAVGDSDMAGSSLSDRQTFSHSLSKKLNLPVYCYAPSSPIHFLGDERFKKKPPKILIWEAVERTIIGKGYAKYTRLTENMDIRINPIKAVKINLNEKNKSRPNLSTYYSQFLFHDIRWHLTGITPNSIGYIDMQNRMLFYANGIKMLNLSDQIKGLGTVLDGIERIDRYCRVRGIILIYIPLPDKENIYSHLLPEDIMNGNRSNPNFIQRIHAGLDEKKILNVNLYKDFMTWAKKGEMLYFRDDTHWNEKGVSRAVELTSHLIKRMSEL